MSTDWIKMRVDLRTHPKVVRMAAALRADKLRVIGGLFAVWAIFDAHSSDGVLDGYSFAAIDVELGWKGFASAMSVIGWLDADDGHGLTAPRFEEHNGQSAKRRAMEAERKRLDREADKAATKAGQPSASDADKKRTREEKRRKDLIPLLPSVGDAGSAQSTDPPASPPDFDGNNAEALNGKAVVALSASWELPEAWGVDAEALGWKPGEVLHEAEKFRQYWTAGKGAGTRRGVKGWRQGWSAWLGKAAETKR